MAHQLRRLTLAFLTAFMAAAATTGYWAILRREALLNRTDNPRRVLEEQRVRRGTIYDRRGAVLAESVGQPGSYQRSYPYPDAAPVVGYVSAFYGSAGIEAGVDAVLHGGAGRSGLQAYWQDTVVGAAPAGRAVRLSLDLDLQRAADRALGSQSGAVVLLEVQSGEILTLASHPTFDPNSVDARWAELTADPRAVLFNRATLALYPPGGAMAPFILAVGLEAGLAAPEQVDQLATAPVPLADGLTLGCRVQPPSQQLTYARALDYGCPHPFTALSQRLSEARLLQLFTDLRFADAPDIAIATAASPAIDLSGGRPQEAAGQGRLTLTPLHLATAMAAFANDGVVPAPRLLLAEQGAAGLWNFVAPSAHPIAAFPADVANEIRELLSDGLAATAASGGRQVAWYSGFATTREGSYVVVVLVEDGDSNAAQLIGQRVLRSLNSAR